jgi:aspartyl/asparaginyl beta-hydroxylase (cupin superfamily)
MEQAEVQQALAQAGAAARAGRGDEARRLFRAIVERAGEQPVALNALGLDALARADLAAAEAYFVRATRVDERSPELFMNLAKARRDRGDPAGERQALEGALAIDQRHFMALVRLAELHERNGADAEAATRWSNVLLLAAGMAERAPALEALLAHARTVVGRRNAALADAVERELAAVRDAVPRDRRRRVDACIDHALGRRQIYVNHCAGMHFPFLPAEEFFDRAHFPWLPQIEAETEVIRAELEALLIADAAALRPYVQMEPGTPANIWSGLDRSLAWSALHLWKDGVRDDAVCARVPRTAAAIERLPLSDMPGRTPTVFFSLLKPGTHLPAHTGVSNVRTIVHLPLIVPAGCAFRVGGETREWREGEAWAFDDTIEHEAWNRSDAVRAILIFDVWNPYIAEEERAVLRAFYSAAGAAGAGENAAFGVSD